MIYGVSGNGKIGIGYVKRRNSMFKPKRKDNVKKLKAPCSHSTNGHTHKLFFEHKPWVDKTSGKTNHKGPQKIWVPKAKIVYVQTS